MRRGLAPAVTTRKKSQSKKALEPLALPSRRRSSEVESPSRRRSSIGPQTRGRNFAADQAKFLSEKRSSPDAGTAGPEGGSESDGMAPRYFAEVAFLPIPALICLFPLVLHKFLMHSLSRKRRGWSRRRKRTRPFAQSAEGNSSPLCGSCAIG